MYLDELEDEVRMGSAVEYLAVGMNVVATVVLAVDMFTDAVSRGIAPLPLLSLAVAAAAAVTNCCCCCVLLFIDLLNANESNSRLLELVAFLDD